MKTLPHAIFLLCLAAAPVPAQAVLVKDLNAVPVANPGSTPQAGYGTFDSPFEKAGNYYFFNATTPSKGCELWRTDGTTSGTLFVKDIYPGVKSSFPKNFRAIGGKLYFAANDGKNGTELWVSDGTASGTHMVKDLNPGSGSSSPFNMIASNGKLLFSAYGYDNSTPPRLAGTELFVSDGTSSGTHIVKDIYPGSSSSRPAHLIDLNGKILFAAQAGYNNIELYVSDGTTSGTKLLKDINPSGSSYPDFLTRYSGKVYFSAYDGNNGKELWITDGTASGTKLLKDLNPGSKSSSPMHMAVAAGKLYFDALDSKNGFEPWVSDGTAAGTKLIKDINPGISASSPYGFTALGSKVLFRANDGKHGDELFATDGTAAGTYMVKDIYTRLYRSSHPDFFCVSGGYVYFQATNGDYTPNAGKELWRSDGTMAGTVLVKDIYPGFNKLGKANASSPYCITPIAGGKILFSANDGAHGLELWISNGTSSGTTLLKDVNAPPAGSSLDGNPLYLTDAYGTIWFNADDGVHGKELWKSDGTAAGTFMVKDIFPGSPYGINSSFPQRFTLLGNEILFTAKFSQSGAGGTELFKVNPVTNAVTLVKDIYKGYSSSSPGYLTPVGNKVFFIADTGMGYNKTGCELWVTDGTTLGTKIVKDIWAGTNSSGPQNLTACQGKLFFSAREASHGYELWKSDGTAAGTVLVKDIYPGSRGSNMSGIVAMGEKLYFYATGFDETKNPPAYVGGELFVSDGTTAGTKLLKDIYNQSYSSQVSNMTVVGNSIYFSANSRNRGVELWKTDGTTAGTKLVKDIVPGYGASRPKNFTPLGNNLFFSANDGAHGYEPWISNGTASGTFMLKDINPGSAASILTVYRISTGSRFVYFTATDNTHGSELWRTDGTTTGTVRVTDILPGTGSSSPAYPALSKGRLYFSANDGLHGHELFSLFPGASSQPFGIGYSSSSPALLKATDPVLGGKMTITVSGLKTGQVAMAYLDLPQAPPFLPLPSPLYLAMRFFFQIPTGTPIGIPNDPALTGLTLALQAFTLPDSTALGTGLTNGVYITLGR